MDKIEEELLIAAAHLLRDVDNFGADNSSRRKSISSWLNNYKEAARPKAQEARMTVQITEQDFYDMRNQRDNERLAGTAKDIEIRQLREAFTQALERIEYANAGDLVTIPRELVLAMEAKMKEQAAEISRLAMDLEHHKYALDDSCACGHSLDNHEKSGIHPCSLCHCPMFWAKVAK